MRLGTTTINYHLNLNHPNFDRTWQSNKHDPTNDTLQHIPRKQIHHQTVRGTLKDDPSPPPRPPASFQGEEFVQWGQKTGAEDDGDTAWRRNATPWWTTRSREAGSWRLKNWHLERRVTLPAPCPTWTWEGWKQVRPTQSTDCLT